jgi:hypothetical protein
VFKLLTEGPQYNKAVVDKLCMAVALIGLHTSSTVWKNSIGDLIEFGSSRGPAECFVTLSILKHFTCTFQTTVFHK